MGKMCWLEAYLWCVTCKSKLGENTIPSKCKWECSLVVEEHHFWVSAAGPVDKCDKSLDQTTTSSSINASCLTSLSVWSLCTIFLQRTISNICYLAKIYERKYMIQRQYVVSHSVVSSVRLDVLILGSYRWVSQAIRATSQKCKSWTCKSFRCWFPRKLR